MLLSLNDAQNRAPNAQNTTMPLYHTQKQDFAVRMGVFAEDRTTHKADRNVPMTLKESVNRSEGETPSPTNINCKPQEKKFVKSKNFFSMDDQYLDELRRLKKKADFTSDFIVR